MFFGISKAILFPWLRARIRSEIFLSLPNHHPVVQAMLKMDPSSAASYELNSRKQAKLPPYYRVAVVSGDSAEISKFTGWVKDPFESIQEFDLLMLTSKNEGLPLVMLEAANLGKPTISRNVGGVSEFIKSNSTGFLISGDYDDMARLITDLDRDRSKLEQAGVLAKKLLSTEFSVETMAKQYSKIYDQLMIRG